MKSYPYGPDEHYPDTDATREYRQQFNTRIIERGMGRLQNHLHPTERPDRCRKSAWTASSRKQLIQSQFKRIPMSPLIWRNNGPFPG